MANETRFAWDPKKARENQKKHGIGFAFAAEIFSDPHIQTEIDESEPSEIRYWSIGNVLGRVIAVVHTSSEDDDVETIRIISARKATRRERLGYEENS